MEASSSSSSLQKRPDPERNSLHSKIDADVDAIELPIPSPQRPPRWPTRLDKHVAARYPALHRRAKRLIAYVKGPGPKHDISEPSPCLQLTWTVGRTTFTLPMETNFIRRTQHLTSPWLLAVLAAAYIIGIAFFARAQSFEVPAESFIGCTAAYWSANDGCGLDGQACAPFTNTTFDFRCPAQCAGVILQNPRTIGNEQMDFQPLIVGGGDDQQTYRGDSFICAAALQAGLISNSRGGCGTINLVGNFTDFLPRSAHGLTSIGFRSVFPLSFRFSPSPPFSNCADLRNEALVMNVIITALLFMVLRPKPIVLFWCLVCIGYWHVTLFSQPRSNPPDLADGFGTFLPTLFICYAFWRLAYRFVLPVFATEMPLEGAVWYLGPYWVTVLENMTCPHHHHNCGRRHRCKPSAGHPEDRLAAALSLLVYRWRASPYGFSTAGTAFPTRLSAIYQGLLLGMFLNGAAAWGFDSILQTAAQLRRDAPIGSALPTFLTNSTTFNASVPFNNQTIFWQTFPDGQGWDGFALLVDDVERYVGTALNYSFAALEAGIPHFFRLAFTNSGTAGDFTMPATLWPNGTWVDPLPGPS